jgi:hypothetical protein
MDLVRWAWEGLENGDALYRICVARPDAYAIAILTAQFAYFNYRNERLQKVLRHIYEMRLFGSHDTEHWNHLGVMYSYGALGLRNFAPDSFCARFTAKQIEPWTINDGGMYAITHEVFYLTDFGAIPRAMTNEWAYIRMWLPVWMRTYQKSQNYDVLSELIMVAKCLNLVVDDHVVASLLEGCQANGSFLGPHGAGRQLIDERANAERNGFYKNYHTTLVGAMALAMLIGVRPSPLVLAG